MVNDDKLLRWCIYPYIVHLLFISMSRFIQTTGCVGLPMVLIVHFILICIRYDRIIVEASIFNCQPFWYLFINTMDFSLQTNVCKYSKCPLSHTYSYRFCLQTRTGLHNMCTCLWGRDEVVHSCTLPVLCTLC